LTVREPKPSWQDVPEALRQSLERIAGAPIADAQIIWGGYGPSATFVLTTATGERLFCKGTHPGQTELGHRALLRERQNYERFAQIAQFGPAYRGGADHGDWHLAVLDFVPRRYSVPPWTAEALAAAFALIVRLHRDAPVDDAPRPLAELLGEQLAQGWTSLLCDAAARERFLALFANGGDAAHWFARHGERLADMAANVAAVGGPRSWVHMDIRSDNLVFAERAMLVDWPSLSHGAVLVDVAGFLPSLEGEGGPCCADALRRYEDEAGVRFAAEDVAVAAAFVAGFFAARAGEPEIAGLPRLRWVQRLQLFPALRWLCQAARIGLPPLHRAVQA